ncbi:MAG TPA: CsbD family protein [Nitrososphaerales archaeon]|nr:CsbD family protein [Nitrososphaerales archaeon]
MKGKKKQTEGKIREEVGKKTDNISEELEGKVEQFEGKIQEEVGKVRRAIKEEDERADRA